MEDFIIQGNSIFPIRNLTVFYSANSPLYIELPNIKGYNFAMERDEILRKFLLISKKERVLEAAKYLLGFKRLQFDTTNNTFFADNSISSTIFQLSSGTAQAIGICTIILNPMVFGQKDLLIRYPESCLHPKTQSALGEFIIYLYNSNLKTFGENLPRILVETWSEHIINGIRIGISKYSINPEEFVLNFIHNKKITAIYLNSKSEFSSWPSNFMDQSQADLKELLFKSRI